MKTKVDQTVTLLRRRIIQGDYIACDIPAERKLATELSVSHMTARKALQRLVDEKMLYRRHDNGRLELNKKEASLHKKQVTFLRPAFPSGHIDSWQINLSRVAEGMHVVVRPMFFSHWDEPVIIEALDRADGVFVCPGSEPVPDYLIEKFKSAGRVISLGENWTDYGIPSISMYPYSGMEVILDHLVQLGHSAIDCLNNQPINSDIRRRIDAWMKWKTKRNVSGMLINDPVAPGEMTMPRANQAIGHVLQTGQFTSTALLCTTLGSTVGAIRALHEHGLKVGRDVSVCTIDAEGWGQYMVPTITCLEDMDPKVLLSRGLEWLTGDGMRWKGSTFAAPPKVTLFAGESTGPACK